MWGGKKILNLPGKFCLVFCLLLSLAGHIWSTETERMYQMSQAELQEWEKILEKEKQLNARERILNAKDRAALTVDQNQLKADRKQLEADKKLFQSEKELNAKERTLLDENWDYWNGLKTDQRNRNLQDIFVSSIVGFTLGAVAGAWGGFSLGVRVSLP